MLNIGNPNNSESKHLLGLVCKKFTGKQLGDLKKKTPPEYRYIIKRIPEYTINLDYHNIVDSESYLQWIEEGDQEEYILFDVMTVDEYLKEEISNVPTLGDEGSVIEGTDEELLISIIKNHATIHVHDVILPSPEYLIINAKCYNGGYPDYDYEIEYSIDGFINKDLETIKFNLDERSK
jgi:rhodanese-related sulfurtransferase